MNSQSWKRAQLVERLPQEHEDLTLLPNMYNGPASMAPFTAVLRAGKAVTGRSLGFTSHPAQPHC